MHERTNPAVPDEESSDGHTARKRTEVFDLLSNARRRFALSHLADREAPIDVDSLAMAIAAREEHIAPNDVDSSLQQSVFTGLCHNHLPQLADAGVVRYDTSSMTVRLDAEREITVRCLEHVRMDAQLVDTAR